MDADDGLDINFGEIVRMTAGDRMELDVFIRNEGQKANVQKSVHGLAEACFKKCITGSISSGKLASKEESCVQNCVGRFIDSNLAVLKHLETLRAGQ